MKTIPFKLNLLWLLLPLFFVVASCGDDDDEEPMVTTENPVASFQYDISADNFLTVSFSNFSQNATSNSWDFGDGNTSTDESPTHTYDAAGDYTVTLTASNTAGSSDRSESFTLTDPNAALKLLTGETSKTWRLYREGTSMSLGPDAENPAQWWAGLTNDGTRPCLYEQEIIFHLDGTYEFDDKGMFWGEFGVFGAVDGFPNTDYLETCFDATAANMVNARGEDVSAWLSGSHQFTYDASNGQLDLTGEGVWIGIPKLGSEGETLTPVSNLTTKVSIEEFEGYDVMLVEFIYDGVYWPIRYASYSDASLEPAVETAGPPPFGEDLPDASPSELTNDFASADGASIDTIQSGSTIDYGVDDPADASAAKVGQFNRTGDQFQELQFQTSPEKNDINFENLSTVSIDVFLPSSNDYSGSLLDRVIVGFADRSNTEQWWTDNYEFVVDGTAQDQWVTLTFNLGETNAGAGSGTILERNDLDMIYVQIGGGNHTDTGTFYVRNLRFQ